MSVSFLSEILAEDPKKRKSPSLSLALKIQRATGNAVCLSDWPKLAEVQRAFESSLRPSPETS